MAYIGKVPTAVPLTGADIQDGTVQLADLSATGTKDATTFLRGDNTFATVSSDYVKLASGSFSSNTLSFDGYFTSDYSHYKIILTDIVTSTPADVSMRFRQSNADVTSLDYFDVGQHGAFELGGTNADGTANGQNANAFRLHPGWPSDNATNRSLNSEITIFNPLNTSLFKHIHFKSSLFNNTSGGYFITSTGGGYFDANTSALSGFTILTNTGNITSGNCYLYGVKA